MPHGFRRALEDQFGEDPEEQVQYRVKPKVPAPPQTTGNVNQDFQQNQQWLQGVSEATGQPIQHGNIPVEDRGKPVWETSRYKQMNPRAVTGASPLAKTPPAGAQPPQELVAGTMPIGPQPKFAGVDTPAPSMPQTDPQLPDLIGSKPGAPGATPDALPQPGDFSLMQGYNDQKWGNQKSVKYIAGSILSRYPPTPEGLQQAVQDPDFKAWFPNAQLIGDDKVDFGGVLSDIDGGVPVGVVDVGLKFSQGGGEGWWWGAEDPNAATGGGGGGFNLPQGLTDSGDPLADIIAQIQALTEGGQDPLVRKALENLL